MNDWLVAVKGDYGLKCLLNARSYEIFPCPVVTACVEG